MCDRSLSPIGAGIYPAPEGKCLRRVEFPNADASKGCIKVNLKVYTPRSQNATYGISDFNFTDDSYSVGFGIAFKTKTRGAIFAFDATADRQLKGTGKEKPG